MENNKALGKKKNNSLSVFKYSWQAILLVWQTSKNLTIILAILNIFSGILPAVMAYIGKLIIDSVLLAIQTGSATDQQTALYYILIEAVIIVLLNGVRQGITVSESLLRALMGQKVNVMILDKALQLDLKDFEDSEFYDKMTRARREASTRPLSLVKRVFNLIQNSISLVAYGALLLSFSPLAVLILVVASIPPFIAETKYAGQAFRLFSWRTPEAREQMYLETLIAREDHAREVKLYQLGKLFLNRYIDIFNKLYKEDKNLTLRRGLWVYLFGLLSTAAFYGVYAWIAVEAVRGAISLGDMTMYLTVFRQGQQTFSATLSSIGGMYEDNLYISNLYEFLDHKVTETTGSAKKGTVLQDGIRFENVSFCYPGSDKPVLKNINLHLKPGEKLALVGENGAGKTTLITLLTKLYSPTSGRILLDGVDLQEWDADELRKRIGVIFQNFVRYQLIVGENIGVGNVDKLADQELWKVSAEKGMATPFIDNLPQGYNTQLGRWFKDGQELSGGQWQKVALSRAFMRESADILVLDEPTAAMDAEAEYQIFGHFKTLTKDKMVILISHRFSTVRMADYIVVMENGEIVEDGSHQELMELKGRYERLFSLQAGGYK